MESNQKDWNKQQREFRLVLLGFDQHERAIELFLGQHAVLHSAKLTPEELWSFEDEVLNDMTEERIRRIPSKREHSVAWCIWHLARIEDVTINILVADSPQVFDEENWFERMKAGARHTGNAMSLEEVTDLSTTIDIDALREYRLTVGRRTREVVRQLKAADLQRKVDPARLQRIVDEGAVVEEARGLIDYWGKRNIAGLLLMPPTRHNFVHLNEVSQLKHRRK